jgi:tetratricopeptide (TPR) repeat protein
MGPEKSGLSASEPEKRDVSSPPASGNTEATSRSPTAGRPAWPWLLGAALVVALAGFFALRWAQRLDSGQPAPQHVAAAVPPVSENRSLSLGPGTSTSRAGAALFASQADEEVLRHLPDPASPLPATQAEMAAEAKGVATCVVQQFPSDPDALEVLARYEKWLGNTAEALAIWSRCLELNPNYGYAYYGKAAVAGQRGDYDEAAGLFREALERKANWPEAEVELARALIHADRPQEAIAVLEKHVQRQPFLSEAYALLGQAFLQCGEFEQAKTSYGISLQVLPSHTNAYYGLATAHTRLGEREQAREMMEQFRKRKAVDFEARKTEKNEYDDLEAMRIDSSVVYLSAGQIYFAQGRLGEAEQLWRRAAALNPGYVECRQALAWLYRSNGYLPQAIEMLEQLARIEPDHPSYLDEVARLKTELGRPAEVQRVPQSLEQRSQGK